VAVARLHGRHDEGTGVLDRDNERWSGTGNLLVRYIRGNSMFTGVPLKILGKVEPVSTDAERIDRATARRVCVGSAAKAARRAAAAAGARRCLPGGPSFPRGACLQLISMGLRLFHAACLQWREPVVTEGVTLTCGFTRWRRLRNTRRVS